MTLALRPARRYLLSNRRHATPQKDITGYVPHASPQRRGGRAAGLDRHPGCQPADG